MINILVLLGAPGSGKGTVAQHIKNKYDVFYFSTGNLLRNEVKERSNVGRKVEDIVGSGGLVGDDVVNEIVVKNIEGVASDGKAIILDGYPRTKSQALVLDEVGAGTLKGVIRVIELDVDLEEVVTRISRRRMCIQCGNVYGPMDKMEICACGGELVKRKDDEEPTVRRRLEEYKKATLPLSEYYSKRIIKVCGMGSPEEVVRRVDSCLHNFGIEERR
jgi:adenylate kinase